MGGPCLHMSCKREGEKGRKGKVFFFLLFSPRSGMAMHTCVDTYWRLRRPPTSSPPLSQTLLCPPHLTLPTTSTSPPHQVNRKKVLNVFLLGEEREREKECSVCVCELWEDPERNEETTCGMEVKSIDFLGSFELPQSKGDGLLMMMLCQQPLSPHFFRVL